MNDARVQQEKRQRTELLSAKVQDMATGIDSGWDEPSIPELLAIEHVCMSNDLALEAARIRRWLGIVAPAPTSTPLCRTDPRYILRTLVERLAVTIDLTEGAPSLIELRALVDILDDHHLHVEAHRVRRWLGVAR